MNSADDAFERWLLAGSAKLENPDGDIACPREAAGRIEVSYLELAGDIVEAHLYCATCGSESWVRHPRPPSKGELAKVKRYGVDRPHRNRRKLR